MFWDNAIGIKALLNIFMIWVATVLTYLEVDKVAISMLSILLIFDYITGVIKAKSIKESITSNKMKYGILSKLILLIIPVSLAVSGKATGVDISFLISNSIFLLVLSELYSIVGNIYTMRTKKELPEWEVMSIISKTIRDYIMSKK